MDREGVMRWVADCERGWRAGDPSGVARFTGRPRCRTSPYAQPEVGHAAIQAFWLVDEGRTLSVPAEPVRPGTPYPDDDEAAEG